MSIVDTVKIRSQPINIRIIMVIILASLFLFHAPNYFWSNFIIIACLLLLVVAYFIERRKVILELSDDGVYINKDKLMINWDDISSWDYNVANIRGYRNICNQLIIKTPEKTFMFSGISSLGLLFYFFLYIPDKTTMFNTIVILIIYPLITIGIIIIFIFGLLNT